MSRAIVPGWLMLFAVAGTAAGKRKALPGHIDLRPSSDFGLACHAEGPRYVLVICDHGPGRFRGGTDGGRTSCGPLRRIRDLGRPEGNRQNA